MLLQKRAIQRNAKCPCGSGKKVKHCCLAEIRDFQARMEAGESKGEIIVDKIFNKVVADGF